MVIGTTDYSKCTGCVFFSLEFDLRPCSVDDQEIIDNMFFDGSLTELHCGCFEAKDYSVGNVRWSPTKPETTSAEVQA